jgi:8-amino-7-oxononanoate synthase
MSLAAKFLRPLEMKGRLQKLSLPNGIDLASNDYLGMANNPKLREAAIKALKEDLPIGSGSARLVRGQHPEHVRLEEEAAAYFGHEKTLFFNSGFTAIESILTALPQKNDVILYDSAIHASARNGIAASPAQKFKIPHNNMDALSDALSRMSGGGKQVWIVLESVYAMDGDIAQLAELQKLAKTVNAYLIVDESHATGMFGPRGRGFTDGLPHENLIVIHACDMAIGVEGALVCASAEVIDVLVNMAAPFMYATAPMPLQARLVREALTLLDAETWRREKLTKLIATAGTLWPKYPTKTGIFPIIVGDDMETHRLSLTLQEKGFDVRTVRPPNVPEGTARLRLTFNVGLEDENLHDFADALSTALRQQSGGNNLAAM